MLKRWILFLEQNYISDVTNNLELPVANLNSPNTLKILRLEKEHLHEKIIKNFSQPLRIIFEQIILESEVITSNSSLRKLYNDCLEESGKSLSTFAT